MSFVTNHKYITVTTSCYWNVTALQLMDPFAAPSVPIALLLVSKFLEKFPNPE